MGVSATEKRVRPAVRRSRWWRAMVGVGLLAFSLGAGVAWLRTWGVSYQPLYEEVVDAAALGTVRIAPPEEALTFAREAGGRRRVLAVTSYQDGLVEAVDLGAALGHPVGDPIELFRAEGYDSLRDLVRDPPAGAVTTVEADALGVPVDLASHQIAAGTNFPEHAGEVGVDEGPFLFPKLVIPTGPRDQVAIRGGLLDYEGEVAFVPLLPLKEGEVANAVGLVLINDFTDRATLLRHVDFNDLASGNGFTTGKSFPGYLPVGDLFVIPRDVRSFTERVQIRLYVNGHLRQRAPLREMVWDLDELISQTWARQDMAWDHNGDAVTLLGDGETIAARTPILSGTPAGTVFTALDTGQRIEGFVDWLFGGWGTSIPRHASEEYILDAHAAAVYLQPGDRVAVHVDDLGVIVSEVVP